MKLIPDQYIVTVKAGENPRSVAASAGVDAIYVYDSALNGFTAKLNNEQLELLRNNKSVLSIEPDQTATTNEKAENGTHDPPRTP